MTSEALNPSWQLGDPDIQIGNASLQLAYKDVSPTSNSTLLKSAGASPAQPVRRVRSTSRLFLRPR